MVITDRAPSLGGEFAGLSEAFLQYSDLSFPPLCISSYDEMPHDLQQFLNEVEILLGLEIQVESIDGVRQVDAINPGILFIAGGEARPWTETLRQSKLGNAILKAIRDGTMCIVG